MPARHFAAALALFAISALAAHATAIVYHDRSAFDAAGAFTPVDWSVFGPPGTNITTPDSRTVNGLTVDINSSGASLQRQDEGFDFIGDFAPGDHLLTQYEDSLSDTYSIRFLSGAVRGFGMQFEPNAATGPWRGTIDVYNDHNYLVRSITISGDKTGAEDDSAPFYGIVSTNNDISYAYFWIDQSGPGLPSRSGDVAINTMDVIMPTPLPAPEPASLALVGGGLMGLAMMRLRRQPVRQGLVK
jgi:hypothetical protein